ncbi:DUF4179 domain-containing protein [Anaerosporobacter sp.]
MRLEDYKDLYDSMKLSEDSDQRILVQILKNRNEDNKTKKKGKEYLARRVVKVAVAALVAVVAVSGVAYAATQLWNTNVAKRYGVSKDTETMQKMTDKGFSKIMTDREESKLTVTDNGITVDVVQTLADEHFAYVYFEVEFSKEYEPVVKGADENSDTGVAMPEISFSSKNLADNNLNFCGSVAKVINDHKVAYEYMLMSPSDSELLEDFVVDMNIEDFTVDHEIYDSNSYSIVKGNWNLSWNLSCGTEKSTYEIGKKVTIDGVEMDVEKLVISPLSYQLYVQLKDWDAFNKLFAKDEQPELSEFQYSDGTFDGLGGIGSTNIEHSDSRGTYVIEVKGFDKIMDLDKLTGFTYGGNKISLQ